VTRFEASEGEQESKSAPAGEVEKGPAPAAGDGGDGPEAGPAPPGAEPSGEPEDDAVWRVTIGGAGDAMAHGRVKSTAAHQAKSPDEHGDDRFEGWWFIVKRLAPALLHTDVALFNLETPVATERHEPKSAPPIQNGPPAMLEAFEEVGFDVASLANNHMFDQMREGVVETKQACLDAGLAPLGAGESQLVAKDPVIVETGGARVAFLGWTFSLNRNLLDTHKDEPWVMKWSESWAKKAVAAAAEEADLVVVSMHWGGEFQLSVAKHQRDAARVLCGAGADLVLGSGPHVLQPVRRVKDPATKRECIVAYSLGNLVSNQGLKYRYGWKPPDLVQAKNVPYTRDGLLLRVTFADLGEGPVVEGIEGVPLWTENNWILRYVYDEVPPDRIWIQPILPLLKELDEDSHRKLLEERLPIIEKFVGDLVTITQI
jgi:poly-gamma-glutamate synthesis protein (capsule biosynthesis protein)